ncbi:MAG: TolC family protein [Candidatus Polarisedimenticolia bacterium]
MTHLRRAALVLVILSARPATGAAQDDSLFTLDRALAMAREHSPAILASRARIEEARGRLASASVRMRGNPVLDGGVGTRRVNDEDFLELDVGITQGLGAPGRRAARIEAAQSALSGVIASSEDVLVRHLRDVADTFVQGLCIIERIRLLDEFSQVAEETARVAERRFQAGDVAALDVGVTKASVARARSEVLSAQAELQAVLGELSILLGMESEGPVTLHGNLADLPVHDLSDLLERAEQRPDVRALSAEMQQADAEARMGRTLRQPELDVGLRYELEEEADIYKGTFIIGLPVFDRGVGVAAEADARAERLRIERDGLMRSVRTEVRSAHDAYRLRRDAVAAVQAVVPTLEESEVLAARSYETGQMSLIDLLLVRRGVLETRIALLDRRLEAAVSAFRLQAIAGVLP